MSATDSTARNIEITHRYIALVEALDDPSALRGLLHPDIVFEVFPNLVTPRGNKSGLGAMEASFEQGRKLLAEQRYEIVNTVAAGDTVVLEFIWTGKMAIDAGHLKAGEALRARCAAVIELRD